jgi:hypothetical protein
MGKYIQSLFIFLAKDVDQSLWLQTKIQVAFKNFIKYAKFVEVTNHP